MLEIELKVSLGCTPMDVVIQRAEGAGFRLMQVCYECDTYYNTPDRDLRKTDEGLRVREYRGPEKTCAFITYKGPKRDCVSNTRTEFETSVGDADALKNILGVLGFSVLLDVRKQRREYTGTGPLANINMCLDEVDKLGNFAELEYCAPDDISHAEREGILNRLLSLMDSMELPRKNLTRKSYLEMLIERATS